MVTRKSQRKSSSSIEPYALDKQIGFLLRKAHQRHRAIFSRDIGATLAPTQFAALVSLYSEGSTSQNLLGRRTAMDSATITGVVTRLVQKNLVSKNSTPDDDRLSIVELTERGHDLVTKVLPRALEISSSTLEPLSAQEIRALLALLAKIT